MRWCDFDYMPNCVPEYFREKEERAQHEYEMTEDRKRYYAECQNNLKVAEENGNPILKYGGYEECKSCHKRNTKTRRNEYDDFDLLICLDPDCFCHQKYKDPDESLLW